MLNKPKADFEKLSGYIRASIWDMRKPLYGKCSHYIQSKIISLAHSLILKKTEHPLFSALK